MKTKTEHTYLSFLTKIKEKIRRSQFRATISVNKELIFLYWEVGKNILERQNKEGWGSKVIDRLSKDLMSSFPNIKGLSPRNLKYMRKFAEQYPDIEIVQELLAQLTWYHNITLIEKITSISKPMGISEYKIVRSIPEKLKTNLPTIDELEKELSKSSTMRKTKK